MMNAKSVPIVEIVQQYAGVELKRKGRELWGLCPFHAEKTPSFAVNPEKNVWHCYACGIGGSAVDFAMNLFGLSFVEACRRIEADFGLCRTVQRPAMISQQQRIARNEAALNDFIQRVFDDSFKSTQTIQKELQANYSEPSADIDMDKLAALVLDMDRRLKVIELIASNEPESVVLALKMNRGGAAIDKFGGGNHASGF